MEAILIPITLFLVLGLCVVLGFYYRFRNRQELQITVRNAIDSGQQISPEVLSELTNALFPPSSDLRKGIVLCSIGLAFAVFAFMQGQENVVGPLLGLSAFPFIVGLAYTFLAWLGKERATRT
ncbi:MAG: hypothetical protein GKR90_22720 [Pseudomonadales bacterium]|nr:hypothetical protein [Pseudomonadales bacterium]